MFGSSLMLLDPSLFLNTLFIILRGRDPTRFFLVELIDPEAEYKEEVDVRPFNSLTETKVDSAAFNELGFKGACFSVSI